MEVEVSYINEKINKTYNDVCTRLDARIIDEIVDGHRENEEFTSEITQMLFYLFHEKMNKANELSIKHKLSPSQIKKLVEIVCFLSLKLSMFEKFNTLIKYYNLENIIIERVILKILEVRVKEKNFKEVDVLLKEFKLYVDEKSIKSLGMRLFQEIFLEKDNKNKDYSAALKIRGYFSLIDIPVFGIITREYNQLFSSSRFLTAARIARDFELNEVLVRKAGFNAFQTKLERFKENLLTGRYKGSEIGSKKDDPYFMALKIVIDYKLLNNVNGTEDYYKLQVVDKLKELLKNIAYNEFLLNRDITIVTMSLSKIVTDYNLMKLSGIYFKKELDDIVLYLVNRLDTIINNLETAVDYYDALINLKELYGVYSNKIKNIGKRIVKYFIEKDMFSDASRGIRDFNFDSVEFIDELEEKTLSLLKEGRIQIFGYLAEELGIAEEFANDSDFFRAVYAEFKRYVSSNEILNAEIIIKHFNFQREIVLEPLKKLLKKFLDERDYNLVKMIRFKFSIQLSEITELMRNAYKEVCTSEGKGKDFRMEFNLSIPYVGIINWIFGELLNFTSGESS